MAAIREPDIGRGHRRRRRACGGRPAGVLVLLALLLLPQRAMAADAVDIAAVVGFGDTFQPGRWTPLHVTVTNHGADLSGALEVLVTGGDELRGGLFVTTHRRSLELPRNSHKRLAFTVRPEGLAHPLVIRVRSGGRERARAEVDLRARFTGERLLLVLSRDADLDYLNEGTANGLRVLYPHPELLPVHWRGYDAVAAVVVHGVSLEELSAAQFDALHKWIAQGGTLAVSGGADYARLRGPRLAALLPGTPRGTTAIDAAALRGAFPAGLEVSRPVHVNRLGAFRGHARMSAGAVPLIVEQALGLGRVVYLTFDVAGHPFDRWAGTRELLRENLRLSAPAPAGPEAAEPLAERPLPALVRAEAVDFPSRAVVLLFLALYLGLLLAGCRFAARAPRLAPLWGWAPPMLFAAAAWLIFGPAVFPREPTAVSVAMIEPLPDSRYARLELDLGLYTSRSGALRLEYGGIEPVLQPPRRGQPAGSRDWVFGEGSRPFIEPRDRRGYVLHQLEGEDVIVFRFHATVHSEAAGPRVNLDNATGRPVENLWLVFDGYAYPLGSIADGAKLERRLARRTHGVEVGAASWRAVLQPPPGGPVQELGPARIALERRARAWGERGYPGIGHALLIGYAATPLRPTGASAGWPRRERALVAFQVAALSREQGSEAAAAQ